MACASLHVLAGYIHQECKALTTLGHFSGLSLQRTLKDEVIYHP